MLRGSLGPAYPEGYDFPLECEPRMGYRRTKGNKTYLQYLEREFRFRRPYQILVDATLLEALNKHKHTPASFKRLLFSDPKFFVTQCCYMEHKNNRSSGDAGFVKHCAIRKCKHDRTKAEECVLELSRKARKHHYFVATKDHELVWALGGLRDVPIITVSGSMVHFLKSKVDKDGQAAVDDVREAPAYGAGGEHGQALEQ